MANLNFDARKHTPRQESTDIEDQARDTTRVWSPYQADIFNFIEFGTGNAIVEAVAGSGKSTTLVEGMKRVRGSSLFLAFNKSIADELKNRGVNARTFHSLTYSVVTRHKNQRAVETNKLRLLCDQNLSGLNSKKYGSFIQRLVGLARQVGMGILVQDTEETWMNICVHHDLEPDTDNSDIGEGIELARTIFDLSNKSPLVDFDDLLYIAVRDGLSLQKFDFVFVDEAQDTNAIQRALLRKVMHKDSRIIAVGDPAQAIYGFRGADSDSLDLIASEFNCVKLPLTISYRCPTEVINYAKKWVSHIEAAPNAKQGSVQSVSKWNGSIFKANDLVVCRNTKPIIVLAYKLLREGVPMRIMGKEIGQGLKSLINKMKTSDFERLEDKLNDYCVREVEKYVAKSDDAKAEAIHDKISAILCLMRSLPEGERTIQHLMWTIDSLFAEGVEQVLLSTIHKAKGLEANNVFWLNSSLCPAPWVKKSWQQQQELNLCYVATTRAKDNLLLIEIDDYREDTEDSVLREQMVDIEAEKYEDVVDIFNKTISKEVRNLVDDYGDVPF